MSRLDDEARVELWSGKIVSLIDAGSTYGIHYTRMTLCGKRLTAIDEGNPAVDADDDGSQAIEDNGEEARGNEERADQQKIIIHDRDRIFFPQIGAALRLMLKTRAAKDDYPHYDVVRCLTIKIPEQITTRMMTQALVNGFTQVKMFQARAAARAEHRPYSDLKELPLVKTLSTFVTRTFENAWLLEIASFIPIQHSDTNATPAVQRALFAAFSNFFIARNMFTEQDIGTLLETLARYPVTLRASMVHRCSLEQIIVLYRYFKLRRHLVNMFADAMPNMTTFRIDTLGDQLTAVALVGQHTTLSCVGTCLPEALNPFTDWSASALSDYAKKTTKAADTAGLKSACAKLDAQNDIAAASTNHLLHTRVCLATQRYGHTVFAAPYNKWLEDVGAWIPLRQFDNNAAPRPGAVWQTTLRCMKRSQMIQDTLQEFDTVTLSPIDGGCAGFSVHDFAETLGGRADCAVAICFNDAAVRYLSPLFDATSAVAVTVAELLDGTAVETRTAVARANVFVVCDGHDLCEVDFLNVLQACLAISTTARTFSARATPLLRHLVITGDPQQYPLTMHASGSPFADLIESCIFRTVPFYSARDAPVRRHELALAAASSFWSASAATHLVDSIMARRQSLARDAVAAVDAGRQWIVIGASTAISAIVLGTLEIQVRQRTGENDIHELSKERWNRRVAAEEGLKSLRMRPHAIRDTILFAAPYILLGGETIRVVSFFRQINQPHRNKSFDRLQHFTGVDVSRGAISLDSHGLVLSLASTTIDHRLCCGTSYAEDLRVCCHRQELRAASVVLASDMAGIQCLAANLAITVGINSASQTPMLDRVRWNEIAPIFLKMAPNATFEFIAGKKAGSDSNLRDALFNALRHIRQKPRTLLPRMLFQQSDADENNDNNDNATARPTPAANNDGSPSDDDEEDAAEDIDEDDDYFD